MGSCSDSTYHMVCFAFKISLNFEPINQVVTIDDFLKKGYTTVFYMRINFEIREHCRSLPIIIAMKPLFC